MPSSGLKNKAKSLYTRSDPQKPYEVVIRNNQELYGKQPLKKIRKTVNKKWLFCVSGLSSCMMLIGGLAGAGLFTVFRDKLIAVYRPNGEFDPHSISAQCRAASQTPNQTCFFAQPLNKAGVCDKQACGLMEWRLLEVHPGAVFRFDSRHRHDVQLPAKFHLSEGTECGAGKRCNADGQCVSRPGGNRSIGRGRWVNNCHWPPPCVTVDPKPSVQAIWKSLEDLRRCDKSLTPKYCANNKHAVAVLQVHLRSCDTETQFGVSLRHFRFCDGTPLTVTLCDTCQLPESYEVYMQNHCDKKGRPVRVGNSCVFYCTDRLSFLAIPDGVSCGQDAYCLKGKCYTLWQTKTVNCL